MYRYCARCLHTLQLLHRLDIVLIPILGLAYYLAFIPHQTYPYPLHLDEWFAMAAGNELFTQGDITRLTDPFTGGSMLFWQFTEMGFHAFWGTFQRISGISWITIFRYFPGVVMIVTTLSVYLFAKKRGFGCEAAFFATLVPTTVGILGPAFLVPVATALLFFPLSLFLAFDVEDKHSLLLLFVFITFLLITHAFTAIAVAIALLAFSFVHFKDRPRRSIGIASAVIIPFAVLFPWGIPYIRKVIVHISQPQYLSPFVDYPLLIYLYGYLPTGLLLIGVFFLARRAEEKDYALVLVLAALLSMQVIYHVFHFGIGGVYERGFLYIMLLMSIITGAGLFSLRSLRLTTSLSGFIPRWLTQYIGIALTAVIIILTIMTVIPVRLAATYYHMIDKDDYEAFVWIRHNINDNYNIALLDPWKATAFTAITGKKVYSRTTMITTNEDKRVYEYLAAGSQDTIFLKDNRISLVYSTSPVLNPDLVAVRKNVYLLKEAPD
jgi:hypothetical protein